MASPLSQVQPLDLEDDGPFNPIQKGLEVASPAHPDTPDDPNTSIAMAPVVKDARYPVPPAAVACVWQVDDTELRLPAGSHL